MTWMVWGRPISGNLQFLTGLVLACTVYMVYVRNPTRAISDLSELRLLMKTTVWHVENAHGPTPLSELSDVTSWAGDVSCLFPSYLPLKGISQNRKQAFNLRRPNPKHTLLVVYGNSSTRWTHELQRKVSLKMATPKLPLQREKNMIKINMDFPIGLWRYPSFPQASCQSSRLSVSHWTGLQ